VQAEEDGYEVNDDGKGIGPAQDEVEGKGDEERIEGDFELPHLLHESLSAGIVLGEGVG
jgi:hypothetical protein